MSRPNSPDLEDDTLSNYDEQELQLTLDGIEGDLNRFQDQAPRTPTQEETRIIAAEGDHGTDPTVLNLKDQDIRKYLDYISKYKDVIQSIEWNGKTMRHIIAEEKGEFIINFLTNNKSLKTLIISDTSNGISLVHAIRIMEILKTNKHLESLNEIDIQGLDVNGMQDYCNNIVNLLRENKTLKKINFTCSGGLEIHSRSEIFQALSENLRIEGYCGADIENMDLCFAYSLDPSIRNGVLSGFLPNGVDKEDFLRDFSQFIENNRLLSEVDREVDTCNYIRNKMTADPARIEAAKQCLKDIATSYENYKKGFDRMESNRIMNEVTDPFIKAFKDWNSCDVVEEKAVRYNEMLVNVGRCYQHPEIVNYLKLQLPESVQVFNHASYMFREALHNIKSVKSGETVTYQELFEERDVPDGRIAFYNRAIPDLGTRQDGEFFMQVINGYNAIKSLKGELEGPSDTSNIQAICSEIVGGVDENQPKGRTMTIDKKFMTIYLGDDGIKKLQEVSEETDDKFVKELSEIVTESKELMDKISSKFKFHLDGLSKNHDNLDLFIKSLNSIVKGGKILGKESIDLYINPKTVGDMDQKAINNLRAMIPVFDFAKVDPTTSDEYRVVKLIVDSHARSSEKDDDKPVIKPSIITTEESKEFKEVALSTLKRNLKNHLDGLSSNRNNVDRFRKSLDAIVRGSKFFDEKSIGSYINPETVGGLDEEVINNLKVMNRAIDAGKRITKDDEHSDTLKVIKLIVDSHPLSSQRPKRSHGDSDGKESGSDKKPRLGTNEVVNVPSPTVKLESGKVVGGSAVKNQVTHE